MLADERHRHKRAFQPAITSYFARDDDSCDLDSEDAHLRQHHARATPGRVQAGLLQVGMRVRKSVPEGYRTHRHKMMALPSIQTTLSTPSTASTATMTLDVKAAREPVADDVLHQRELLPFCGLHKIGGFAAQPTTNIHLYAGADTSRPANHFPLPAEAFSQPFHSSSQDSGYGSVYTNTNPAKRTWHDEDDVRLDMSNPDFCFSTGRVVDGDEVSVSPLSETPEHMMPAVRQFKQPKSRRRVVAGTAGDFEEADFLNGVEVAMGGT